MNFERKIIDVGNSLGILLPPDMIKYYNLEKGKIVILSDEEDHIELRLKELEK